MKTHQVCCNSDNWIFNPFKWLWIWFTITAWNAHIMELVILIWSWVTTTLLVHYKFRLWNYIQGSLILGISPGHHGWTWWNLHARIRTSSNNSSATIRPPAISNPDEHVTWGTCQATWTRPWSDLTHDASMAQRVFIQSKYNIPCYLSCFFTHESTRLSSKIHRNAAGAPGHTNHSSVL